MTCELKPDRPIPPIYHDSEWVGKGVNRPKRPPEDWPEVLFERASDFPLGPKPVTENLRSPRR